MVVSSKLISRRIKIEDTTAKVFGIEFFRGEKPIAEYDDLSCCREYVISLIDRLNCGGLEDIHIDDVINDILYETPEHGCKSLCPVTQEG